MKLTHAGKLRKLKAEAEHVIQQLKRDVRVYRDVFNNPNAIFRIEREVNPPITIDRINVKFSDYANLFKKGKK